MNAIYLVTPLAMLAAFAGYSVPANARLDREFAARAVAESQALADARRIHDEKLRLATEAHQRRTEELLRARTAKELQMRAAIVARDRALFDDLDRARATRENLRSEIITLENTLRDRTTARDHASARRFAADEALEARRIERRNADLELQRMTELLAAQVDASALVSEPLFPPPQPNRGAPWR